MILTIDGISEPGYPGFFISGIDPDFESRVPGYPAEVAFASYIAEYSGNRPDIRSDVRSSYQFFVYPTIARYLVKDRSQMRPDIRPVSMPGSSLLETIYIILYRRSRELWQVQGIYRTMYLNFAFGGFRLCLSS